MTQQVRTSYRRHRRAAWGLAIALAAAVAVVVIPIASGAPDKTYTFLFPSAGAVSNPSAPVAGSTTAQTLCTNTSYGAVKFVVSNTAKTASLGSVNVTFPTGLGLALGTPALIAPFASGASASKSGSNVVSLRGLSLQSKTGKVTFQVPISTNATVAGPSNVTTVAKQSNDFSDAGTNPDANTFAQPNSFSSLTTQTCDVTISGQVYHDRDQSGAFSPNNVNSPATNDIAKAGWTVTLERKSGATYTTVGTDVSDLDGNYSMTGQLGNDYRLCVTAPASPDPDNASPWSVRKVAAVTLASGCPAITSASGSSSLGLGITGLTSSAASGEDFAVVPITSGDIGPGDPSEIDNYLVTASGNSTKAAQRYVQETWTNGGLPYFVFAPINPCSTDCDKKVYLLESMTGTVKQSALSGAQVHLKFDDEEPFTNFVEMPYCLQDPRPASGNNLLTTEVLPSGAKSCIVQGQQEVDGDGTAANAVVTFTFIVYTSYDGARGFT